MKKTFLSILFFLFMYTVNAQCVLEMTVSVDGAGNIVTTNSSTGADPTSYYWYVYNLDLNPWVAEYVGNANTFTYAPLSVGNLLVCLVGTEIGNNVACDSLCEPLTYTQSMMSLQQNASGVDELNNENSISVYPIPTHDVLKVVDAELNLDTKFKVFDIIGNFYKVSPSYINNEFEIDVSSLPKGVYFLFVENPNRIERFVID